MEHRLDLRLSQKLIMTPQLQQAIKLLQLSRMELTQALNLELLENPLLEDEIIAEDDMMLSENADREKKEDYAQGNTETEKEDLSEGTDEFNFIWEDYYGDDKNEAREAGYFAPPTDEIPSYDQTLSKPVDLTEHLLWQLRLSTADEKDEEIGAMIIGNIDEDGYLRATVDEIGLLLNVSDSDVERVIKLIHGFDPMGVCARDIKECLLIQIEQLDLEGTLVEDIILHHLEDIEKNNYQKIAKKFGVPLDEVIKAVKVIEGLEPKPGRAYSVSEPHYILPDVFVVKSDGDYLIYLNEDGLPKLRISPFYRRLLRAKKDVPEPTLDYMEKKFKSAIWFMKSIEQRNRTIYKVAESIVKFQRGFFDKGMEYLKPLVLRDVAADISMHESTISRATTNKYMFTPQGLFELKFFFSTGISKGDGNVLSSLTVQQMIKDIVYKEDGAKPLNDQQIAERLKAKNINISRRTVAKYRKGMNISATTMRKRFV
ncbi:MAG: RNA polymerase factor sigma-54 [Nitrospirae bacterium]|nr:RNA polymerase factor sigma-54 [Nitrospirota bacterium]